MDVCEEAHNIQCDGTKPICGPCQIKRTQCTYSSDPNVPRFAALKTEYEQVKTRLDDLSTLYERLKHGSASESCRLLERIRTKGGTPDLSNDIYKPCQAVGDVQIRDYEIGPESKYEESRAGSYAPLQERTIPRLEHTSEMGAVPQAMENIDPLDQ